MWWELAMAFIGGGLMNKRMRKEGGANRNRPNKVPMMVSVVHATALTIGTNMRRDGICSRPNKVPTMASVVHFAAVAITTTKNGSIELKKRRTR